MALTDDDRGTLEGLERRLLDPAVRRSPDQVSALLDDEFVEVGQSGRRYDRPATIAALAAETSDISIVAADFEVRELAPGVVLITYRTVRHEGVAGGDSAALRSSIWRRVGDRWRVVYHQGTPAS